MTEFVPLKSVLFMPGSNPRTLEKALDLAADAVVFDLEDATAPDKKDEARDLVQGFFAEKGADVAKVSKQFVIRVNGFSSQWQEKDVAALKGLPIFAVIFPKVESVAQIEQALAMLDEAGVETSVQLWAMIETPMAILKVDDIAEKIAQSNREGGLLLGGNDLSAEMNIPHIPGRGNLLYAASRTVMAAKAYGLTVLDVVYNDLENDHGYAADAQLGVILGFDGKCLIHPKQIDIANQTWTPTPDQVENAKQLIATFEAAKAEGKGVVTHKGKMIEELHVRSAQKLLIMAGEG